MQMVAQNKHIEKGIMVLVKNKMDPIQTARVKGSIGIMQNMSI